MELDKAPRPWLGAHLRYGDSCGARGKRTGRVCAAAEDYARVAADMILQYGYRSVVVATDTDAALDAFSDELKRLAPAVKVYARHDARVDPKIYKKVKRMEKLFVTEDNGRAPPVVEPWAEYYGFAVDLLALAAATVFWESSRRTSRGRRTRSWPTGGVVYCPTFPWTRPSASGAGASAATRAGTGRTR